jgi:hypothetical protein
MFILQKTHKKNKKAGYFMREFMIYLIEKNYKFTHISPKKLNKRKADNPIEKNRQKIQTLFLRKKHT